MNDNMDVLIVTTALATYAKMGAIEALAFLFKHDYTLQQGVDLLAMYDQAAERVEMSKTKRSLWRRK